ncbi:metallophosphoesterase [Acinetobacter baumannii]|nr:metallophosphoesterase [Acinetobacter baumannii]
MDLFPLDNLIEFYDASEIDRLFVVGDLHGCYQEFMNKLKQINFDMDRDMVISVGDLVDRGKESFKCLELVKQPWFKAIRGNHEQMCLEGAIAPEMKNFHSRHGGQWLYDLNEATYEEALRLCLNLPIALEIDFKGKVYGFIHADIKDNDWNEFKQKILENNYFSNNMQSTLQSALWGRSRIRAAQKHEQMQVISGINKIYLGHTVVDKPTQVHNCFYLDTGAVFGGELTIKEIES